MPTAIQRLLASIAPCSISQAGHSGMTFLEVVREVPVNALARLKKLFAAKTDPKTYPTTGEVHDIWTAQ